MSDATDRGALAGVEDLAERAGAVEVAREAAALAERLREGRFYVACVGQFKRGKSTLINALVGVPVLPAAVVPVTAVITVVRWGPGLAARVRFGQRDWEDCDPATLATYVSEEHNPGNEKGVTGLEVLVPSPLLAAGMCLVDTPGIASISPANTATTRAFVPHIDAALVVLGADPPISGEELSLVEDIAAAVPALIFVVNKADRLAGPEVTEALRFSERVLTGRLGHPVGPILQVSAAEALATGGSARQWPALVARLEELTRDSGADLVRAAGIRETRALVEALLGELDERRAALERPVEESRARAAALRRALGEAERALDELGPRLTAVQDRLDRAFTEARDTFFARALPEAAAELRDRVDGLPAREGALRPRATDAAIDVTRQWLDRWRREQEPQVVQLYREGVHRFVALLGEIHDRAAAVPELARLPRPEVSADLTARSRFFYTEMLHLAPMSGAAGVLDVLRPPGRRRAAAARDAVAYLGRLLEVNSARVKNDFRERVLQSRRRLESEMRRRLGDLMTSTERVAAEADRTRAEGTAAVEARLATIAALRGDAEALRPREGDRNAQGSADPRHGRGR